MIVPLTPFGVPSEYSCNGCLPTGSSFSCVAPAIGRLMFSNLPPLGLVQLQTLGGVYSGVSVISKAPGCYGCAAGLYSATTRPRRAGLSEKASDEEARAYSASARVGGGSNGSPGWPVNRRASSHITSACLL